MRVVVQRVQSASVTVEQAITGSIGAGLLILLGITATDTTASLRWLVRKCANLRIFRDDEGRMNRSLKDVGGDALVVSQFTLYGDASKGNRPSFTTAAPPTAAEPLYEQFCDELSKELGRDVARGRFGAMMDVALVNDGPVTLILDRDG